MKYLTLLLYISAYLYSALLKNHGLKPWAHKTLTLDLHQGLITKRGFDPPATPLILFLGRNSAYTSTKTVELPKLRTLRVGAPTWCHHAQAV